MRFRSGLFEGQSIVYEVNIVVSQELDIVTGDVRSGVVLLKHRNNAVIL